MKGKLKTVFVSLSMAFLFLLACAFPMLGGLNAAAAENDEPTSGHLYYFSDSAESAARCRQFVADGLINTYTLYYYATGTFTDTFRANFNNGAYNDISNSYVIFEMASTELTEQIDDGSTTLFTDDLTDFFSYLKTNGCKIMFISATDEARYTPDPTNYGENPYSAFLDYVDIHVKVDFFFTFTYNIYYRAQAGNTTTDTPFQYTSFLLDSAMFYGNGSKIISNSAFGHYFVPHILDYQRELIEGTQSPLSDVLDHFKIKVFYYNTPNIWVQILSQSAQVPYEFNNTGDLFDAIHNDAYCAIGTSWGGETYMNSWLEQLQSIQAAYELSFPVYLYNSNGYNITVDAPQNLYQVGKISYEYIYKEFLVREDLSGYNNVVGRCEVTHSPMLAGNGGWMIDPGAAGDAVSMRGWQKIMSPEDAAYFRHYPYNDL